MTTTSPAATWAQPGPPAPRHAVTRRRRRPATVPLWWRDASGVALWALLVAVTCLWVLHGGVHDLDGHAGALDVGRPDPGAAAGLAHDEDLIERDGRAGLDLAPFGEVDQELLALGDAALAA